MTRLQTRLVPLLVVVVLGAGPGVARAQYFGQNKVQHHAFDFRILETTHFDIYYYPEEAATTRQVARLAERWYARLSRLFDHDLSGRQAVVLYASHPHFEQTDVIGGMLGEGTGGVTESFKRRIVMPVANGLAETDHVLGHELVHAFQYDLLGTREDLPAWFIEGMAEYLSLGSEDATTAAWVRDAAIAEHLPAVEDLANPEYFPYRWGHAFWAYIGGRWGDQAIPDILHEAAAPKGGRGPGGGDPIGAVERVTGLDQEALTRAWHDAIAQAMVRPIGEQRLETGRPLVRAGDDHELNVGPALSPDGTHLAYLSSRDRLSIDLYVADARTGEVERRLTSTAADPHFDSLQFIASAGAWAPDNRRLAVTTVRAGAPVMTIFDAAAGSRLDEYPLPGVDEAFTPAWSPDGHRIAFSGLAGGQSDLFVLALDSGTVSRLTDDAFADLEPDWSPDGARLVFVTDRFTTDLDTLAFGAPGLAVMTVSDRSVAPVPAFRGAPHVDPQWGRDGRTLYFVAAPNGIPNVYRRSPGGALAPVTRVETGVTGITHMSPVISVAGPDDRLVFVLYRDGGYTIRTADGAAAPTTTARGFDGAALAPLQRTGPLVDRLLDAERLGLPAAASPDTRPYEPGLSLDYVGQEFGVATASHVGAYASGGIAARFSDMLGHHQVDAVAQVNGSFKDVGAQVGYRNRTQRWAWGGIASRVPYVTGFVTSRIEPVDGRSALVERVVRDRQVDDQVSALAEYPFSRAMRVEFTAGLRHLGFEREITSSAYDLASGRQIARNTDTEPLASPVSLAQAGVALIRDTAVMGPTGPLVGHRSHFELTPAFGGIDFTTAVADARQYWMPVRPVTVAARVLHVGRYGADADSARLSPLFLGYPGLVRGYGVGAFDAEDCVPAGPDGGCPAFDRLVGSRLLVASAEVRAPLVGLFTGDLDYGPIPVEVLGFFDAGVAWNREVSPRSFGGTRPWVRSAGAGLRVNVFGYLVVEVDALRALDLANDGWRFTVGMRPGF
ncbi:MAG: BamA/TamA family outer membrane protein [Vicinamibacterales bacterium]